LGLVYLLTICILTLTIKENEMTDVFIIYGRFCNSSILTSADPCCCFLVTWRQLAKKAIVAIRMKVLSGFLI